MTARTAPSLRGLELRYALVLVLVDAGRPISVAELARALERRGFRIAGRPGKVISDALRWEVRRGRVDRVGLDRYRRGRLARSTLHRMRHRIAGLGHPCPGLGLDSDAA
ncbi:MAG: hypothetical protein AAGF02_15220 [Actinomycetota bacterium]